MNDYILWALELVDSVDPLLRLLIAGVAIFLETAILIGLIVPGDTTVLVASTAVSGAIEFFALVVVIVAGSLGGESIGFALGRFFGPKLRSSWVGRRIGKDHWNRATAYVERRGGIAVFLSRFLPVLHSLVPMTVGMTAMRYRRFIAWTTPACIIWSLAYAGIGAAAAQSFRETAASLKWAGFAFLGIVVVFIVLIFIIKRIIGRLESRHMRALDDAPTAEGATTNDDPQHSVHNRTNAARSREDLQ